MLVIELYGTLKALLDDVLRKCRIVANFGITMLLPSRGFKEHAYGPCRSSQATAVASILLGVASGVFKISGVVTARLLELRWLLEDPFGKADTSDTFGFRGCFFLQLQVTRVLDCQGICASLSPLHGDSNIRTRDRYRRHG
jgi:hypothetical protein